MKTAVVILNWNGKHLLEQFLPKVIACSPNAEVVVADNASSDDSVAMMRRTFPSVTIIENPSNNGYAGGYNEALAQVDADYYVLLNSDIEVTPNWIEPVIKHFESDPLVAAIQPKIRAFKQRNQFEYAGAAGGYLDRLGFPFCRGRIFEECEVDNGQYDDVKEVFWASGACMFVRASVFHECEGFDELFFAHMEEIDLCWRMKNRGYKILVEPASVVFHIGGGTLSKSNWRKTYLNFRNNLELIYKNIEGKYLFRSLFMRMTLDGIAAFKFLFTNGFSHFYAIIRAHLHFYRKLPSIRQKRRKLKAVEHNRNSTGVYMGSIVADYFIRGKKTFRDLDIH
ncbi:MAG TPA: glycosyltransferase family 2 protein [Flavobacteriales bacterium]|nr:glycosyltransferase family 2 protein [Flavobacteriales bacterium]HPH82625.1 glycosyltransferase family 2 protein [Flavobacteriales bacterium]